MDDFAVKQERLRQWMRTRGLSSLLLTSQVNFAWLTGGRGHILLASEGSCGGLLLTPDRTHLVTNNIEAQRLLEEEMSGLALPVLEAAWDSGRSLLDLARDLTGAAVPRSDQEPDIAAAIAPLRWTLTATEQARYRELCARSGRALEAACRRLRPGQSEFAVAGLVAEEAYQRGVEPILILVASDGRVATRRHPLPTEQRVERYAMLVLCARRHGLISACTRLVHLGRPEGELVRRHRAVATIEATMIAATRPGAAIAAIFARAVEAYAAAGFPGEWQRHHQGGLIGYQGREYFATADCPHAVAANQAFAWNPSIAGVKSEDTILVTETGVEILTQTGTFPTLAVDVAGEIVLRPDILVL